MLNILFHHHKEIKAAKKLKSMHKTMRMILSASAILALLPFIWTGSASGFEILSGVSIFVLSYLSIFFLALLLQAVLFLFVGKGTYFNSITAISYGFYIFSLGLLVMTLISLLGIFGQIFGFLSIVINSIVFIFSMLIAVAVMIKATEIFFETDILTVLLSFGLIGFIILIALYIGLFQLIFSLQPTQLPFLGNNGFSNIGGNF